MLVSYMGGGGVLVINLLPLCSDAPFTLCSVIKESLIQVLVFLLRCERNVPFSSRGRWRDTAGGGRSPALSGPDGAQLWVRGHSVEPASATGHTGP